MNQLCSHMEGFLKHCERDYLRNTMMKHEAIFRCQVNELHQLYEVQKQLMDEHGSRKSKLQSRKNATSGALNSDPDSTDWISLSTSETCHTCYLSDDQSTERINRQFCSSRRSKEIVFSEDACRVHKGLGSAEAWAVQDQAFIFGKQLKESCKLKFPQHSWPGDEGDIQLTLTIACGTDNKRSTELSASKY